MILHASAPFDVKLTPQNPDSAVARIANLARMSIDKPFHGELEATSKGEMIFVQTDIKGSGYGASQWNIERTPGQFRPIA